MVGGSLGQKTKDPDETLDYTVDWAAFLGADTILTVTWTVPTGLTNVSDSKTDITATIWVSGGTAHQKYTVDCEILTAAGRIGNRSFVLQVIEK